MLTTNKRTGYDKTVRNPRPRTLKRKNHSAVEFHQREYERLRGELEASYQDSTLPEGPTARDALNDLLVRLRLGTTRPNES